MGVNTKKTSDGIKNTTASIKKLNTGLKQTASQTKNVNSRMKEAIASTVQWSLSVGSFYAIINKIKDSFEFTVDLNRSLVEIAMVTQRTTEEVSGLKDEYLQLGKAINVSTRELASSAVALYRQGLSAGEVNERLGEIAKTAKVAGLTVQEVTRFVTSGVNAMKVETEEYNDVLLKVASIAATDYEKLGTALQKSAVSFTSAGFSLEKAVSTIAVLEEITQESSESIGSSLKTILARFNKLTAEGKDNTEVLNGIDKALQSVNLTLQDSDGQFRDTSVVLDELGAKWEDLDRNTQNYLLTEIAGVRQAERARVLFENYGRALEITAQAYDAAGTASEQYLKFQESIEGKLNALTNAWERLYGAMVQEGTIKDAIDILTEFVEVLISIEESFGLLNLVLLASLPKAISSTTAMIATMGATSEVTAASVTALGSTLGFLAVGIGAIVGTLILVENHYRKVTEALRDNGDEINKSIASWRELNIEEQKFAKSEAKATVRRYGGEIANARSEVEYYTTSISNLGSEIGKYNQELNMGIITEEQHAKSVSKVQKKIDIKASSMERFTLIIEAYDAALSLANMEIVDTEAEVAKWTKTTEHWSKIQEAANKQITTTTEAVRSLSKEWHNSVDRIQDLINNYDNLTNAEKAQAEAMIKAEIAKTEQLKESTLDRLKLYDLEFEAMMDMLLFGSETLTDAQLLAFKTLRNGVSDALQKVKEFRTTITDWEKTLAKVTSTTKETVEAFKDLSTQIDSENIKSIERYRDTIVEALDEEKELIDRNKESWERDFEDRETASDRYYEDLMDSLDSETDALKENRDIQSEIETIQEKQLSLMTLQDELLNASKEKNVRILTSSGWQWIANPSEIKRINDEISNVEDDLESAKQAQAESNQDRARARTKAHYEAEKLIIDRAFEDEKLMVTRGYEDQYTIIDGYLDDIKDLELTNYDERLQQLNGFVNSYNSKMASMGSTSSISGGMEPGFIGSGGTPTSARDEIIQQMKLNSSQWGSASPDERKRLADANLKLGSKVGWTRNTAGEWIDESGKRAYANGGLNNYTGDAAMHGTSTRPEMVLNNSQAAGLFNFIKGMDGFNSSMMLDKTPASSSGKSITIQNLTLPGVKDSNGFISALQRIEATGGGI